MKMGMTNFMKKKTMSSLLTGILTQEGPYMQRGIRGLLFIIIQTMGNTIRKHGI